MSKRKEDSDSKSWAIFVLSLFVLIIIIISFLVYATNLELEPENVVEKEMQYVDNEKYMGLFDISYNLLYEMPSEKKYYRFEVSNWEYNNREDLQLSGQFKVADKEIKDFIGKEKVVLFEGEWRRLIETNYTKNSE